MFFFWWPMVQAIVHIYDEQMVWHVNNVASHKLFQQAAAERRRLRAGC